MKNAKFYSQVMALFDRFSALPAPSVTRETQTIVQRQSTSSSTQRLHALPGDAPQAVEPLWLEVAKLLARSGAWRNTLALLDGLPPALRSDAVQRAVHEQWPLPPDVLLTLRMTTASLSDVPRAPARDSEDSVKSTREPPHEARRMTPLSPPHEAVSNGRQGTEPSDPATRGECLGLTGDALLRAAFACRRPATPAAAAALAQRQHAILHELARRGMAREVVQCVVNWRRRGLLADSRYASTTLPRTTSPAAVSSSRRDGDGARGGAGGTSSFDVIVAVREMLFPPPSPSIVAPTSSHGATVLPPAWRVALADAPLLFARCVRDGAACANFLRNGTATPREVYDAMSTLLEAVVQCAAPAAPRASSRRQASPLCSSLAADSLPAMPLLGRSSRPALTGCDVTEASQVAEDVEVLWRAVSCLTRGVQAQLRQEPKAVKQRLLHATAAALDATVHVQLWLAPHSDGRGRHAEASAGPQGTLTEGISPKTMAVLRSVVESLCSVLPQHEAQVRFLRLELFARIALALEALAALRGGGGSGPRARLPNALVQCLFLCLGDDGYARPSARGSDMSTETAAVPAWQPTDTPLFRYLYSPPRERGGPALALIKAAHTQRWFRVTGTHLRSLLSGLQSISIVKTWQEALRCVEFFETQLRVRPNDSTMPTLMLNLSQDSWRRAFEVLRYYEDREGAAAAPRRQPPAAVMRDLHLVSIKHGAWEATLRMMDQLLELQHHSAATDGARRGRQPRALSASSVTYVGFMNYLYSLYAAGVGGQVQRCITFFAALADAPGQRAEISPYNEITVAVGGVALLDYQHYEESIAFADALLSGAFLRAGRPRGDHAERVADPMRERARTLTAAGGDMAAALKLLGMLHQWRAADSSTSSSTTPTTEALVALLNALAQPPAQSQLVLNGERKEEEEEEREEEAEPVGSPARLRRVLHDAVTLASMCNMRHLRAPIRLVFDTVAGPGVYEASTAGERTMETRQVSYRERLGEAPGTAAAARSARRSLYIPPSHTISQATWLANALGRLAKESEGLGEGSCVALTSEATRAIAEGLSNAGVGAEFLKASLL